MKKIFTIIAGLMLTASVFAQAPEKMSYQAVVRNSSDALVTSTAVGMQISILQGGATGTAVYVETQTPTTNANGLVSLEIGTGTLVSGDFTNIDWANDTYFIKTETDPTGGTTYTITGTSQLMSVPYALHSKTADNIVGGITETDPIYTASQAANITSNDITVLSNTSNTNTGDQDLSGITTLIAALEARITALEPAIGDMINGGIVFWIDPTDDTKGLVAALVDQSTVQWGCLGTLIAGADGTAIGTGAQNTIDIETGCTSAGTAADICANISLNGFNDWFLPSKDELDLMYNNIGQGDALGLGNVGGFANFFYWSSTEFDLNRAWSLNFSNGSQPNHEKGNTFYVRAVRAF